MWTRHTNQLDEKVYTSRVVSDMLFEILINYNSSVTGVKLLMASVAHF